jgi:hypothetical protein
MTVRKSVVLVGIALVLVGASTARADPQGYVWMDYITYNGAVGEITQNSGAMSGLVGSGLGFGRFEFDVMGFGTPTAGGPTTSLEILVADSINYGEAGELRLYGYCIDSGQYVDGGNNKYELRPLEDIFTLKGVPLATAQVRSNDLRKLYGGYLASVDTTKERAAFGAATWEIVYEDSGSYSLVQNGVVTDFSMKDPGGADDWFDVANGYLASLASQPVDNEIYALYDPLNQDFAIVIPGSSVPPVPEPFTMATAFLAIGSFGMYIRKHTRKGLPGPALSLTAELH